MAFDNNELAVTLGQWSDNFLIETRIIKILTAVIPIFVENEDI